MADPTLPATIPSSVLTMADPTLSASIQLSVLTMAGPIPSKAIFPFFETARELRNQLYRYMTCDTRSVHVDGGKMHIRGFSRSVVRRLNHQFTAEYDEEVFRRMQVVYACHRPDGDQLLTGGAILRRSGVLDRIQHVAIQCSASEMGVFLTHSADRLETSALHLQMVSCLKHFPSLKSLTIELVDEIDALERSEVALDQFFTLRLSESKPLSLAAEQIKIQPVMHLTGQLYSVNRDLFEDNKLRYGLETSIDNYITYRATPSTSPPSWNGLDLTTFSAGTWDYENACENRRLDLVALSRWVDDHSLSDGKGPGPDMTKRVRDKSRSQQ